MVYQRSWRVALGAAWLCAAAFSQQTPQWTFSGPSALLGSALNSRPIEGPVAAIAADSSRAGMIYAAAAGGVWLRTASANWLPLNITPAAVPFSAVSVEPGSVIYAGSGYVDDGIRPGVGLLVSSDGGVSWSQLGASVFGGLAITRIVASAANPLQILVATVAPQNSASSPGLYRSTDGGATWQPVAAGGAWDVLWDSTNGVILAAVGNQLLRSIDNGSTFASVASSSLPAGWGRAVLAQGAPGRFVALFANAQGMLAGVVGSSDDGATWSKITAPAGLMQSGDGLQAIAAAADPQNAAHFWLVGDDVYETRNGGVTWSNNSNGAVGLGLHALTLDGGGSLWLSGDAGIWEQSNDVDPWTFAGAGLDNIACWDFALITQPAGSGVPIPACGTAAEGVVTGSQPLNPWTVAAAFGSDVTGIAADVSHPGYAYAALSYGREILATTNGTTWAAKAIPGGRGPPQDTALAGLRIPLAVDPNDGAVYAGTYRLWRSTDFGQTWSALAGTEVQGIITAIAVSPPGSQSIWIGSSTGQVLHSSDAGVTWRAASGLPAGSVSGIAISALNPLEIWVGYASLEAPAAGGTVSYIWASTDGGVSWQTATGAPAAAVSSLVVDPVHDGVVAATAEGVYASSFAWSSLGAGPPAPVSRLVFDANENLYAASYGRGVWTLPLSNWLTATFTPPAPASAAAGSTVNLTIVVSAGASPVEGIAINWTDDEGWAAASVTNASGVAAAAYPVPQSAGPYAVTARLGDANGSALASAQIQSIAAAATRLGVVSGAGQTKTIGAMLAPIVVAVIDQWANGVTGVSVAFSDNGAGGNFAANPIVTDSNGHAIANYTLPRTAGPVTLTASAAGLGVTWNETASAPPDFQIVVNAPTAPVVPGTVIALPLQIVSISGYAGKVQLSCLSAAITCTVTPATITGSGSATATVPAPPGNNSQSLSVNVQGEDAVSNLQHEATVAIALQGFTVAAANAGVNLVGSGSTGVAITVTPFNGFSAPVSFGVTMADGSALPAPLTAAFSPNPLSLVAGASTGSSMLTVSQAGVSFVQRPAHETRHPLYSRGQGTPDAPARAAGAGGFGLLLAGILVGGTRRRRRLAAAALAAMVMLALLSPACDNGGGPPVPITPTSTSTYPLVITATSEGLQASVPLTVTATP